MHVGMRQYWQDLPNLEAFTRTAPRSDWWRDFNKGAGGLLARILSADGGIEGLHLGMLPLGFGAFAGAKVSAGDFKTARRRLAA
jgi:hypothetical protein